MLPTRKKALSGLDYTPKDYDETVAAQKEALKTGSEDVIVKPWRMEAGCWSQFMVKRHGTEIIICISEKLQKLGIEDIIKAIKDFYELVDWEKTSLLKKASVNDKVHKPQTTHSMKTGQKHAQNMADIGLEKFGMEGNSIVYKERVIQVFTYLQRRMKDENIAPENRLTFSTQDVYDNVFEPVYRGMSEITIKNKSGATIRYMMNQGWVEVFGRVGRNQIIYKFVTNPFEAEMPAQAEPLDKTFFERAKAEQLQSYRQG